MSSIDPNMARTAEDFVMLLRQARAMSELTVWQLQEQADLDPAAVADALARPTLPDEELVVALLRACGHDDVDIAQWLAVRDRLTRMHDAENGVPAALTTMAATTVLATVTSVRPRHTLRIPGKGLRRAPGSQMRLLAMAAVAAVVAIGSILIIVSAVDDDGLTASPPLYATGAAPGATPSAWVPPTPSAEAAPSQTPLPTATPSASPSPTRPPVSPTTNPGVLRSGTATVQDGQSFDLDGGGPDLVVYSNGDSIRADAGGGRRFAASTTATKQACTDAGGYQRTMENVSTGQGICVRTDTDRYAHLTITRTAPLAFSYVVWS